MTAKEFLKQYERAERLVKQIETEYAEERERINNIKSALGGDGLPSGNTVSQPTETAAERLLEKAEKLESARLEALRVRQIVYSVILSIPDVYGSLLYERYINLKGWEEVADVIGYSLSRTFDLHNQSLEIVEHRIESEFCIW